MARGWKRAAELLLAHSGLARVARTRLRPSTVVLAYHNIVPTGEDVAGDISLHVDQVEFARQLDFLQHHYDIVGLHEMRDREPTSGRGQVAVTFDDAYHGTMTAGLDEVTARDLPATVFVPPALIGDRGFWWDLLASGRRPLDPEVREYALWTLGGETPRILAWAMREGLRQADLPLNARPASEATILNRASEPGVTFGSHSWDHRNLAAATPEEAGDQFTRSKRWLLERRCTDNGWLAYPYGLSNPETERIAADHFAGALLVSGGVAQEKGQWPAPTHATPRVNVPRAMNLEGLALRLAGVVT